jgi:hypothetical protein
MPSGERCPPTTLLASSDPLPTQKDARRTLAVETDSAQPGWFGSAPRVEGRCKVCKVLRGGF